MEIVKLESQIKLEGVIEYLQEKVNIFEALVQEKEEELNELTVENEFMRGIIESGKRRYESDLNDIKNELQIKKVTHEEVYGNKFNSEGFINEMESIDGVEDTPIAYEEYEEQMEQMTERELRGDF